VIFSERFRGLSLRDLVGDVCMNPSWFFPFDSSPKSVSKGLDFGVFGVLGLEEFLAGFLRFLLIERILVDHNLAMECT
jgi:hypothetical protein